MTALTFLPLAVASSDQPGFLEMLGRQLDGVLVIFLSLASIWLVLEISARLAKRRPAPPSPAPAPAAPVAPVVPAVAAPPVAPVAAAPAPAPAPGLPPELVVAITAAVHQVLGGRVRIATIAPLPDTPWAFEGRRQIFSSHQTR